MPDTKPDQQDISARHSAAEILRAPRLEEIWRKYHYSQRKNSTLERKADELENLEGYLSENPNAIKFIYELTKLHIGALESASAKDVESAELKQTLENMSEYLVNITYPTTLLDDIELDKDEKRILKAIEKQTVQGPGMVKEFWGAIKHGFKHTWDDTKEFAQKHKKTTALGLSIPVGAVTFSYMDIKPPGGEETIDSSFTAYDNYADAISSLIDNPDALNYNPDAIVTNINLGCHDHLEQLAGYAFFGWEEFVGLQDMPKKTADFIINSLNFDEKKFEHCIKIADSVYEANETARTTREIYEMRMDEAVAGPFMHALQSVIPESTFLDSALTAADVVHTSFKFGNNYENTLHFLIFAAAAISTNKAMRELKSTGNTLLDFGRRSVSLNTLLLAGGSIYAYNINNSLTEAVIGATAGALTGEIVHRAINKAQSPSFAKSTTINISESLTAFANPTNIISNKNAAGQMVTIHDDRNWFEKHFNKIALGTVATTLTTLDFIQTGGQYSGYTLGGGGMAIMDFVYNLFEDPGLHGIFAAAGALFSGTATGTYLLHNKLANKGDKQDNDTTPT